MSELTENDLRERSELLDSLQTEYAELAYVAEPKMPCDECGGGGNVDAGSLGSICLKCMGARVVNQPFCEPMEQPPFAQLREAITEYGKLLVAKTKDKDVQLPPADSILSLKEYKKFRSQGKAQVRALHTQALATHKDAIALLGQGED